MKASLVVASGFCALVILLPSLRAQSPEGLRFDVASVKASDPRVRGKSGDGGGRVEFLAGRVSARNVTAQRLILDAFRLLDEQLVGAPKWLESERFDVEAKAESGASDAALHSMLRNLLTERFHLKAQASTREIAVWAVLVAKSGFRAIEIMPGEALPLKPALGPGVKASEFLIVTMPDLIAHLNHSSNNDFPLVDHTGLKGKYAFNIEYGGDGDFNERLQEAIGLRFVTRKEAMPVLLIDSVTRPSVN